jgi:hypothetical protein
MSGLEEELNERLMRVRRLLARGGWIEATSGGYGVRTGGDRRRRILITLGEADVRRLVAEPGLRPRPGGGWAARAVGDRATPPPPGRPGWIEGERMVMEGDGRPAPRRANLGQSAIAWLARRNGPDGRPWLQPAQVAAACRLAADAEAAARGPSLTLRWEALPRTGSGGSAARAEPGDTALAAASRVAEALRACGPAAPLVEAVCIRASALQAAERDLNLRRRGGKRLLQTGLTALAAHYRIG